MGKRKGEERDPASAEFVALQEKQWVNSHPHLFYSINVAPQDCSEWQSVLRQPPRRRAAGGTSGGTRTHHRQPPRQRAGRREPDAVDDNGTQVDFDWDQAEDQGHGWEQYPSQLLAAGGVRLISANSTSGDAVYGVLDYTATSDKPSARLAAIQVSHARHARHARMILSFFVWRPAIPHRGGVSPTITPPTRGGGRQAPCVSRFPCAFA
jgi:hypothetical protein